MIRLWLLPLLVLLSSHLRSLLSPFVGRHRPFLESPPAGLSTKPLLGSSRITPYCQFIPTLALTPASILPPFQLKGGESGSPTTTERANAFGGPSLTANTKWKALSLLLPCSDLNIAFFIRNIARNPCVWEPACYESQGFLAFSDFLASLPRFRIPEIQDLRAFPPPWVCSGPEELAPTPFVLPKGFAFLDDEGRTFSFSPWDPTSPNHPTDEDLARFLGIDSIGSNAPVEQPGDCSPSFQTLLSLLYSDSPTESDDDANANPDVHVPQSDLSGGALDAAELGKLAQKIKNLLPHFQIQQIRAVLLTDNKALAKIAKANQDEAIINIFSAAAKRLNMVPKQAPPPPAAPEPSASTNDAPEEGWSVKGRGRSKSRNRSPSQAPEVATATPSSPDRRAKSGNVPKRTLTPCADGWNIPIIAPSDVRYDQSGLCATDSAAFASQLSDKCKLSTKTIAILAPKNLAVGHGEPRMMIVPFLEKREGYPTRKIDMQVWLHQLTPNKATFAHERKITDLSAVKTKTLITRCRLPHSLIPTAHREDFAKGYKPIMKLVLAEILDDKSALLIDVWSPKWNDNFQAFIFLMRFKEEDAEKVLALSKPGSIIVDTPVELANSFKHVWLRVDGENFDENKVLSTLSSVRNFGAFEKKGTWAVRTLEKEFTALKASLGIDANPSYVVRGLPSDYSEVEVADFCKNSQWDVTVEATSRRFEFGRTRWLARAPIPPTTNSTFCFLEFQRLRITIDPTAQVRTAIAKTPVAFQDFQVESFDSPVKPKAKGKGRGKGTKVSPSPLASLEAPIPAPATPRPLSVPPPFVPIHTPERRPCLNEQRSRTPRVPNARVHFEDPPADKESYELLAQKLAATDAKLEQLTAILQNFAPAMHTAAASSNPPPSVPRTEPTLSNPDAYPSHSDPDAYMAFEGAEFPTLDDSSDHAHNHDYVLLTGPHANKIARGKYYVTDKTFPGVAFLVKTSFSATHAAVPEDMLIWYHKGLFLTIEIFVQDRWISLCNSYVKHGDDHEPFLMGLDSFLSKNHRCPIVAMGDFNADVTQSLLPATKDAGFRSLADEAPFDFISFRTKGRNEALKTSFIDNILLAPNLAEFALPLGISWPRPLGHAAIGTMLHLEYTRAAKLEIATPTKIRISASVPDFRLDDDTISARWLQWCRKIDRFYSNEGTPRGDHPVFQIREAYTLPKAFSELQKALRDEAYCLASELLQKFDKKQQKAIKDWRLKLAAGPNIWTSTVARWIKKPPLALPYSIKIDQGDCVSSTVGLAEMHDATYSFYKRLYNAGDQFVLPDPKLMGADILPDAFRLENFTQAVAQVIARSSPRKATGLDGLSVADFKALPIPAVNSIAHLFHDILTQATFPEPWLNIKVTLKKGGDLALKDLRPLSIAPVAYRIWAKQRQAWK